MSVHKVKGCYKSGNAYCFKGVKKKTQKQAREIYASGYKEKK